LRSQSDRLKPLQEKMEEYITCGLQLGWLINRQDKQVEIYRAGQGIEILTLPIVVSGEEILPDFSLDIV